MVKNELNLDGPKPNIGHIFAYISKEYVTVDKGRRRTANRRLKYIISTIKKALRDVSPLFRAMFETYLFCGSSFDGLKVGRPDEFDIDLKLYLPDRFGVQVILSDKPGFVHVHLKNWHIEKDKRTNSKYKELEELIDSKHFLLQSKMKQWMQSIVTKAMNKIREAGTFNNIDIECKTSGPAVTLVVTDTKGTMSIDLVAVFRMPGSKWPGNPVRQNTSSRRQHYLVVPKPPKAMQNELKEDSARYWRLSFPEQELDFMNDLNSCKPAIRFLKKLRDTRSHNIPSYFIKTIFLWEVEKRNKVGDKIFWKKALPTVFLEMLKIYKQYIENHYIPYFWNEDNNLIQPNSDMNITNIADYLENMISEIERTNDPMVYAKHILPTAEYERTCKKFKVSA